MGEAVEDEVRRRWVSELPHYVCIYSVYALRNSTVTLCCASLL